MGHAHKLNAHQQGHQPQGNPVQAAEGAGHTDGLSYNHPSTGAAASTAVVEGHAKLHRQLRTGDAERVQVIDCVQGGSWSWTCA